MTYNVLMGTLNPSNSRNSPALRGRRGLWLRSCWWKTNTIHLNFNLLFNVLYRVTHSAAGKLKPCMGPSLSPSHNWSIWYWILKTTPSGFWNIACCGRSQIPLPFFRIRLVPAFVQPREALYHHQNWYHI